ncbi:MAG: chemotaxis protein CheR, partial [Treponema sp.]|nr:chemotaxis protein CheR [Treponema sp.]
MEAELPVAAQESRFDDPVMQTLYQQVEHTLGIRASTDALEHLRDYLNRTRDEAAWVRPDRYGHIFSSPEAIFDLARLLTVHETYFFRESVHFTVLLRELLPRFSGLARPLRICSVATSIGCEAYSIAMVLDYYNRSPGVQPLSWELDAFDIDQEVIATAIQGQYTANAFRDDGSQWKFLLDRYVSPTGSRYTVNPGLRDHIHFYLHNIMDGLPAQSYDLIFFRNIFIYFSPESRRRVMDILVEALIPDRFLIVGISETAGVAHPLLTNCFKEEAFYFQKRADKGVNKPRELRLPEPRLPRKAPQNLAVKPRKKGLTIEPARIADLIADDQAAQRTTEKTLAFLEEEQRRTPRAIGSERGEGYTQGAPDQRATAQGATDESFERANPVGNELMTAVIALINQGDYARADTVLTFIEQYDDSSYTNFLRGEYFYLRTMPGDAEYYYKKAGQQDTAFWPAFYRLTS